MLRSKIKGKAVVQSDETERDVQPESGGKEEGASNKREVLQGQGIEETVSIVNESQMEKEANAAVEVDQGNKEREGQWTPVVTRRKALGKVRGNHDDSLFYVSFVYAHNDSERRCELWEDLKEIGDSMLDKWMILGDFNCCLNAQEKIGGIPLEPHTFQEFREMINHCQLEDMNYFGSLYTWNNNQEEGDRILSKLGRVLVNYNWCRDWPDVQAEFGNCGVSDHSPMVIHWPNSERCKGQTFKFLNHLTLDDEFIQIVNQKWSSRREGCAMFRIMRNLEHLKGGLKDLNQRKFKSIDVKEIQARDRLDYIQNLLQSDPMNNHLLKLEKEAKEEHLKVYVVQFS
ncbi:hypothetical protein RIF29_00657 [Crotalaria pallida]|uniref:Uncharacterized protein n=1 Tax=Crotalaria pallida TaxID=3830 RepID=A0AAN9IWE0_CROPI